MASDEASKPRVLTGLRVRLHPFRHQVSGSTLMFNFDSGTICKPLLPQEYHFYKYLPETLKEFTAKYKGSIEVQIEEEADGTVKLFGVVSPETVSKLNLETQSAIAGNDGLRQRNDYVDYLEEDDFRLKRSGSVEMGEDSLGCYDKPGSKLEAGRRLNKRLALLLESSGVNNRFILLENLVSLFTHPSVLDLKMGTRTHGEDDAENKKQSKILKCEASTSKILGVRLHGMQKYDISNGKFETLTKYEGLSLSADEFKAAVAKFLHDGEQLRQELVVPIYNSLRRFYDCLSHQDTFRFYSSSLLIIYDGGCGTNSSLLDDSALVKVKAIDFAHTIHESSPYGIQHGSHDGPDKGYLLGVQTLIDTFKGLMTNSS